MPILCLLDCLLDFVLVIRQRAEHTIDKTRRGIRAEFLREFHGFVDGNLDGSLVKYRKLPERDAQDVAVYGGDLLKGPFRRVFCDQLVKIGCSRQDAENDLPGKIGELVWKRVLLQP